MRAFPGFSEDWNWWQVSLEPFSSPGFLFCPLGTFLRVIVFFTYLFSLWFYLPASLLQPPLSPTLPRVHLYMHIYAHTHIFPPPLSPCGFKVLILIRFELTYCQSSFSCSSEALGSYHQDLDLGPMPWAGLSLACPHWRPMG